MAIYAIADLHLSFNENKPMNIFGNQWQGYEEKIKNNWLEKVSEEDLVILPGDFSWSMYLEDTVKDFEYINSLPGKKLLLKGNHDYWWSTLNKMRNFIKEHNFNNIDFIMNNSYIYGKYIIAGTRGWSLIDEQEGEKFIKRELARLELSLQDGIKKYGEDKEIVVCMHYPPINEAKMLKMENFEFVNLMKKYNVKKCLYGHLHGNSINEAFEGQYKEIDFKLVSADALNFDLYMI